MEEAERRASPLVLASWLEGPWSDYTPAPRRRVLLYILALLASRSVSLFLTSDGFVSKFGEMLGTPLLHAAMGTGMAFAGASAAWLAWFHKDASLVAHWRGHGGTITFLALSTFCTIGFSNAASAQTGLFNESALSPRASSHMA